jgi:hypothetical protein
VVQENAVKNQERKENVEEKRKLENQEKENEQKDVENIDVKVRVKEAAVANVIDLKEKKQGGAYEQYGSNIADTPSYSTPNASKLPWATGPGSFKRQINCQDNYNHYKK